MGLTREEKINLMAAWDIVSIKEDLENGDHNLLYDVIVGGYNGYIPYALLTDEQLDDEFQGRWDEIKQYTEVLELAHELNKEPIDLLKA